MAGDKVHFYKVTVTWTGNLGSGTSGYRAYSRDHDIAAPGKPTIAGSSDPAFRGDAALWNPEDLLVGALAACHKLWYLHLCSEAGVCVLSYTDTAEGMMRENAGHGGAFTRVTLRPAVTIAAGGNVERAASLHDDAHHKCFIANSVNFPVLVEATIAIDQSPS